MYDIREGWRPGLPAGVPEVGQGAGVVVPEVGAVVPSAPSWAEKRKGAPAHNKYPFKTLEVGQTFRVPPGPDQPKWVSFQVYCSKKNKELGRRFLCHRYPDGTYEVWRQS